MIKPEQSTQLIDRYLRDEMLEDEEVEFETMMLDSPELQLQLETAMAIQQAILLVEEADMGDDTGESLAPATQNNWQPFALAASLVLALISTAMYWKASNETGMLRAEIDAMNQPGTAVLTVPVDIMRSANQQTPDVLIQKPEDNMLLVLQVELTSAVISLGQVHMSLRDMQDLELIAWESGDFEGDRVAAAFYTQNLPTGRVWLEMSDQQGKVLDRRLIEFLP